MLLLLKLLPVGIVLLMGWGLWNKVQALAILQTEFDKQTDTISQLQTINGENVVSIDECKAVNIENEEKARESNERAQALNVQLAAFNTIIDADIEDITSDEYDIRESVKTDETCYTLVDRLPDFLFD